MNIDEMIAVVTAYRDGKQIEFRRNDGEPKWLDNVSPRWNFESFDYRIKPAPREWWMITCAHEKQCGALIYREKQESIAPNCSQIHVREVIE